MLMPNHLSPFLKHFESKICQSGVPWWLSGRRIRCCHCCGSGHCSGLGSVPTQEHLCTVGTARRGKKKNLSKNVSPSWQFNEDMDYASVYMPNKERIVPFLKANVKLFLEGRSKASPGFSLLKWLLCSQCWRGSSPLSWLMLLFLI